MLKLILVLLSAVMIITSCGNTNKDLKSEELQGHISISGAFAMYPLTLKWVEEYKKLHPKVSIDVSAGGAGKGMTDVLNNLCDIAMFSREITEEEILKGAWHLAVAKDAVLPTINVENPAYGILQNRGLTKKEFARIFVNGNVTNWSSIITNQNIKIQVYTRSDACGAAEMWAKYLGAKQEDLIGVGVFGDPGMTDAVKNDKFGIGYNNINYAYDIKTKKTYTGLGIIPLDLNDNGKIDSTENVYNSLDLLLTAIKENHFPSPPARNLYFITKGKPENPIIIDFLNFVLHHGQKYIYDAGYVALSEESLKTEILKLEK